MGDSRDSKLVLTLFGNTPTPKQLFSSLRHPSSDAKPKTEDADDGETAVSASESALPYGINTTQVIPLRTESAPVPKLGDIIAPPASVASLEQPKTASQSPKSNVVRWVSAISEQGLRTKHGLRYTTQPLTAGQWLNYGSRGQKRSHDSDDAKSGEPVSKQPKRSSEEVLLQSVYSSFAPSRDDSDAVIPAVVKNRIWWDRIGRVRFAQRLQAFAETDATTEQPLTNGHSDTKKESGEDEFRSAVIGWEPQQAPADFAASSAPVKSEDRETEELLAEINDLIENLHARQRLRKLAAPKAKSAVAQPDNGEIDTYAMLRDQLKVLIAGLPPFAVSKLNGDQLEELNIRTKIPVETKNYVGIMDEDENILQARVLACRQAASARTSTGPSSSTPSQQQAPRPLQSRQPFPPSSRPPIARTPGMPPPYTTQSRSAPRPLAQSYTPAQRTPTAPFSTNPQQYFQQQPTGPTALQNGYQASPTPGQSQSNYRPITASPAPSSITRPLTTNYPNTPVPVPVAPAPSSQSLTNGSPAKPQPIAIASADTQPGMTNGVNGTSAGSLSTSEQQLMMERQRHQLASRGTPNPSDLKRSLAASASPARHTQSPAPATPSH